MERWNDGILVLKDISQFKFLAKIIFKTKPSPHFPKTHDSLRGVGATLGAGGQYSRIPTFQLGRSP
jgi:hypothetical protein